MIHFNFLSLDFVFENISLPSFNIKHSLSEKLQYLFEHTITNTIQQTKAVFTGQVRVIQNKATDAFNYFKSSVKEREYKSDEAKQLNFSFVNKEVKQPMPNSDLSLNIAPKGELQKTSRPCIPLLNIAKAIEQKAIDEATSSLPSSLDTQKVLDEGSLPVIPLSPLRQKNVEKPLQELPVILDAPLKELPQQEPFASVEICASTSKISEQQQENETFVSSAILFSLPPFSPPKSPPPPLFGLKKTNQYFENEPKIDTLPKRLEIEKMKDRRCIEEKITALKKQLVELQEALIPIKLALDEDDRLNVAQQENQQELALIIHKQLKDNQQKLIQLEKPDPVNILRLSTGLNKSQDICFIEQQRFSEINHALEKFKVTLPSKILKSEEIKVLKETIESLQIDKTNLEEQIALNSQALAALHSLVNNQILFKDFKGLLEKKKTIEHSLTRTIGLLKNQLKTLCPNLMLSPALKERRNSAKPDLAQVLKTHPILISTYSELELVSNFLNDQNASIKLRGDDFHKDLSVD